MSKKVEILSPAGSYESLIAAVVAGADAVYIGGARFGARAFADNLQEKQMLEAIDYVHLHGRKIYLTVNTLLKEKELNEELYNYLLPYYRQGIDAVIVQDLGVLEFIKEHFPDLPIHASTQMTVTNVLGAKFVEQLGVERVVTAREMQLQEIREISEQTNLEIESFVHGALCYCYSGQCLYSSLIGGRSGNRGQCAQPCRLPYRTNNTNETQYVLSLKDMCTLELVPELIEAGISSFKIEGRMKKPEYVALVTAMYRKYVDLYYKFGKDKYKVDPKDREKLMDLYNRGGSHSGYYHVKNGREMLSLTRPNHAGVPALKVTKQNGKNVTVKALVDIQKGDVIELPDEKENYTFANSMKSGQSTSLVTHKLQRFQKDHVLNRIRNEKLLVETREQIVERKIKEKINGKLILSTEKPAKLELSYKEISVEVCGENPQEALKQPMDEERIEKQMRKTGNTPFEFDELEILLEGRLFIPMQNLNELRRNGLEMLEKKIVEQHRRNKEKKPDNIVEKKQILTGMPMHVYVERLHQFEEAVLHPFIKRIYLDCNAMEEIWANRNVSVVIEKAHQEDKEIYLAMPHVFRMNTIKKYEKNYHFLFSLEWDGILIRNYESYIFLKEHQYSKSVVTDYNLYQFNRYAKEFWKKAGVESTTAPLELNFRELQEVGLENSELVVYGYFPMMISAQCVKNTTEGCRKQKDITILTDRYNKEFAVKNLCDYCYNIIYNTAPVVLTDQKEEIAKLQPNALRMHFTIEKKEEMRKMLRLYERVFYEGEANCDPDIEFTRGHFKRGIK